ncbi:hypothetical protein EDB81DRAFT_756532 [Dactylonectria macrodidyma]|uniref:Major facilitator superfamily (MFS) profile domain-containing protein n=1 Tax=Dactylonectria macrodidyma TaxID=307937 RepID=A0A9P9J9S6_9HYPO|nr:hypothetical protein EDB81DRAFT_756532 [Dactylonectria macrodidyma]
MTSYSKHLTKTRGVAEKLADISLKRYKAKWIVKYLSKVRGYGIDSGVITTVIAQEHFREYFDPFTTSIKGALPLLSTGMLIAGRIVGGFAVGMMNMTIPIYNSEIAPPGKRGMIAGLHAQFVDFGLAAANWVGFGCSYASGQFQWRFPLAFQCLPAIVVLIGIYILPYSPRWLLEKIATTRHSRLSNDCMATLGMTAVSSPQRQPNERADSVFTQLSGINVVTYFQTDMYKSLGMTGHMPTLLAGIYGLVGPLSNIICLYYVDTWGRRKTLWITGLIMSMDMGLVMGLSGGYGSSDNMIAKSFTIALIFCFIAM